MRRQSGARMHSDAFSCEPPHHVVRRRRTGAVALLRMLFGKLKQLSRRNASPRAHAMALVTAVTACPIAKATPERRRLMRPFLRGKNRRSRARHAARLRAVALINSKDPRPIFSEWMNASSVRKALPTRELTWLCAGVGRWLPMMHRHRAVPSINGAGSAPSRSVQASSSWPRPRERLEWAGFVIRMWREQLHASARSLGGGDAP